MRSRSASLSVENRGHSAENEQHAPQVRQSATGCSFSAEWPRFSMETDADLDRIPPAYVDNEQGRMQCSGNRCAALMGKVGVSTACAIYTVRPDVCKACLPGDDACQMARRRFNLRVIAPPGLAYQPSHDQ